MRIMGLDYGTKTVGVAISDALKITAQGIETIQRKEENKLRKTCARIEQLIKEYEVEKIVLGFPKHMNNDVGERAEKSLEFKAMLERRTGLEVVMWDERLTTVAAERTLIESSVRRENRKQYVDKIAAVFILQGYLDLLSMRNGADGEAVSYTHLTLPTNREDDAECLILKETGVEEQTDKMYEIVEDDTELLAVSKVFEELLEDVSIEM